MTAPVGTVQDGSIAERTKATLGIITTQLPTELFVPNTVQLVREAARTEFQHGQFDFHAQAKDTVAGVAAEFQIIAAGLESGSKQAIKILRITIVNTEAAAVEYNIREGGLGDLTNNHTNMDWGDFSHTGKSGGFITQQSQAAAPAGSQTRMRVIVPPSDMRTFDTFLVAHSNQAVMVIPTVQNVGFSVTFEIEQFRSSTQF